jgi:S-adenosylmethionine hydrolase
MYKLLDQRKCVSFLITFFIFSFGYAQKNLLVLQTDFGVKDGAVAAMKGVAMQVNTRLQVFDLTHEIPAYNIWEAAYRLQQAAPFWPAGTVFVSVVDPGVGSSRKAIVLQTNSGHYFVGPDNGSFALVAAKMGIKAVREIDEKTNRLPGSQESYTFHGRDLFAYTAARLASGRIRFEQAGKLLPNKIVMLNWQPAKVENNVVTGMIDILDIQYGNVWTNIDEKLLAAIGVEKKDSIDIDIFYQDSLRYTGTMPLVNTFSDVPDQAPLAYFNSLMKLSFALNMGSFSQKFGIASGPGWTLRIKKK